MSSGRPGPGRWYAARRVHYDLLLQPLEVSASPAVWAALEADFAERGLARRGDGWVVELAQTSVEVSWVAENGRRVAGQVRVPVSERTDVLEAAIDWAVAVASRTGARVLDPQVNAVLQGRALSTVDEFLKLARYAGEYLGVSAALGASTLAAEPDEGLSFTVKAVAGLLVFALVLYLSFVWFTGSAEPSEPTPASAVPGSPEAGG